MSGWNNCRLRKAVLAMALATLAPLGSASHSWNGYHWATRLNPINSPFTLQIGNNVSAKWTEYLMTASNDWSASSRLDMSVVGGGVSNTKNCKATAGRVEVCSNSYGNNGWLGIAQIWVSGGHITQGAVKVNDTYFNTAKYDTPAWRRMVMCQEIAHTIGLDHQDETFGNTNLGTCMDYTDNVLGPPSNEHPNGHDYQELEIIYNHADSTSTIGQPASAGSPIPPVDPGRPSGVGTAEWGRLIRSTNGGRTELFGLDLGNGHKVFTFVIFAD